VPCKKTPFRVLWIIISVGGGLVRLAGKGGTIHIGTGGVIFGLIGSLMGLGIHRLILHLRSRSYANRPKGIGIFLYTPIPFGAVVQCCTYLDVLAFFLLLAGLSLVCFSGMHPQPHPFFFFAIFITSFLFKRLSKHLIIRPKKICLLS